jgi:hypothetical protein
MSEVSDSSPEGTSVLVVSREDYSGKIFGSPAVHAMIRSAYFTGTWLIAMLAIFLSPTFLLPMVALLISQWRYNVTKEERDIEKHGDFIDKISASAFRAAGIRLNSKEIIRLWMTRIVISDNWLFTVRTTDPDNYEIVARELKKDRKEN